jgi:hypothetical protein
MRHRRESRFVSLPTVIVSELQHDFPGSTTIIRFAPRASDGTKKAAQTVNIMSSNNDNKATKRKNRQENSHREWYAGFCFREVPVADPPQPGTPHSIMFHKTFIDDGSLMQVHQHVNGLCVVTAGTALLSNESGNKEDNKNQVDHGHRPPRSIEFMVAELPEGLSNKQKKRNYDFAGKMNKDPGYVTPSDTLLKVEKYDGTIVHLPCCVLGRVLELNQSLSPNILLNDPLLTGYLAVIAPQGSFPPSPTSVNGTTPTDDE